MGCRISRTPRSPLRISTARIPWPTAGSITSGARICVARSVHPMRLSPAAATTTPASLSEAIFRIRVSRFPRIGTISAWGTILLTCRPRRSDPVPIRAPGGASSIRRPSAAIQASRGSPRSGVAPISSPSGSSAGMSFRLWTAMSTVPARSASSISLTKSPLPPIRARAVSCMMSPFVRMIKISVCNPGFASRRAFATTLVCVSARELPRLPILNVRSMAFLLPVFASPGPSRRASGPPPRREAPRRRRSRPSGR
ncbi:MAG: hypothetical protein A4E73_03146 [Syntrophaceae bacterium PtaU1.Bin231]|nr:MAG: hypothetical protein A4E73_03146 [Syntrophaceae bacterium PtaU1.Bin231]